MTERELIERVHAICLMADRIRVPSHRHTTEAFLVDRDELRLGARSLYKDIAGHWPGHVGSESGPASRPSPRVPAAVLRHRDRVAARDRATSKTA